ncbi:unnamed protein product [Hymenolepis diminuta]|uniref:Secreted protein n=1 Tax=Hymenolepis diminuta TaxID=6216 RepID=A0A0R3S7R9_HYMDI|nr:unnamed protein product [Hymenolepis diminuta]
MKPIFFLALVALAIAVVSVRAEDDDNDGPRGNLLDFYAKVRNFFNKDPIGQKIRLQLTELKDIVLEVRKRLRQKLGKYLKELQEQN